jgi:hypothetical protein
VTNAAMNMGVQISLYTFISFPLGMYPGVGLLDLMVVVF